MPVLLLAHGALGVLALATLPIRGPWRPRSLGIICVAGAGFGIALVVLNGSLDQWRTTELRGVSALAGATATAAWLVAASVSAPRGRSITCALVGVASSALALAVVNDWVVPTLLFWLCSSLAIAALAAEGHRGLGVLVVLFASDVALAAALVGNWTDSGSWALPAELEGWPFYVLVAAAVLRGGAIPATGAWSLLEAPGAPAVPLLVGGSFGLLPIALGGSGDPWVGVGLFALSLAIAVVLVVARGTVSGVVSAASPAIAVMLGLALVAPAGLIAAGLAAVVAGAAAALWPEARGEGGPDRALALTAVPPTLGFVAAVAAIAASIRETTAAEEVVDQVPWTLVLILGPVALTANLVLAARLATGAREGAGWWGRVRAGDLGGIALLVTRILLVLVIAAALMPGEWLGIASPFGAWDERRSLLFGAAAVAAAAVAWLTARGTLGAAAQRPSRARPFPPLDPFRALPDPRPGSLPARLLTSVTLLLAIAAIATVGWFTFEGLRLGFL